MATFDSTTHMERQLSSLFRAEAQDMNLPLGTWQAILPRMGEPDKQSLLFRIREAFTFPRWRNPMTIKYVAPAATIALAAIAAILFVLLSNSDADENGPVPASTPTTPPPTPDLQATVDAANDSATATAEAIPTATPAPLATATSAPQATATSTPQPTATMAPDLSPGGLPLSSLGLQYLAETFVFDGGHVWASAGDWLSQDVKKIDLEGNVVGNFRGAREASYGIVYAHDSIWTFDVGESQVRRLALDGTEQFRASVSRLGLGRLIDDDGVWFSTQSGASITHVDLEGQTTRTVSLDQPTVLLMEDGSQTFAINEQGLWSVDLETGSMEQLISEQDLRVLMPGEVAGSESIVFLDGIPDNAALATTTAFVFGVEADGNRYVAAVNRITDEIALIPVDLPDALGWPKFRFASDGEIFWVNHTSTDGGAVSRFSVDGTVLATEIVGGDYQPRALRLVGDELWVGRSDGKLVRVPVGE